MCQKAGKGLSPGPLTMEGQPWKAAGTYLSVCGVCVLDLSPPCAHTNSQEEQPGMCFKMAEHCQRARTKWPVCAPPCSVGSHCRARIPHSMADGACRATADGFSSRGRALPRGGALGEHWTPTWLMNKVLHGKQGVAPSVAPAGTECRP